MEFYEVEGKAQFRRYGIPTDDGFLLEGEAIPEAVSYPAVVKAQVLSGHRGQSGGIKIVGDETELMAQAACIRGLVIGGKQVQGIYVVPALDIRREHFLAITLDTIGKRRLMLYSPDGGMDIEQLADERPERIITLDVTEGVDKELLFDGIERLDVEAEIAGEICEIAQKLFKLFRELDATTVEINPLAQLANSRLIAADAKLVIDDSALPRQPDITIIPRNNALPELEREAKEAGVSYIEVDKDGTTGLIVIGAGLGMTTLDTAKYYGLRPYDFTDLGSKICENALRIGMRLVMQNPKINSIIINGFGGNFSTPDVVRWILASLEEMKGKKIPIVVKIRGAAQEEGWKMLEQASIPYIGLGTTDDVVKLMLKEMEKAV